MASFLLSLIIIVAALAGLGLGLLCGRRPLTGTCARLPGQSACACEPTRDRETGR